MLIYIHRNNGYFFSNFTTTRCRCDPPPLTTLFYVDVITYLWESKCLAPTDQMVRAFGVNLKVWGSSPPQVEIFLSQTISQEHPCVSQKWMLLPAHSWHFKCWLYLKNIYSIISTLVQLTFFGKRYPSNQKKSMSLGGTGNLILSREQSYLRIIWRLITWRRNRVSH